MATKILEWIKSNKLITRVVGCTGLLYGVTILPGTSGLTLYRQYYQYRIQKSEHSTPIVCKPDLKLSKLINKVKNDFTDMKCNNKEKDEIDLVMRLTEKVKFMIIPSIEPSHKGSLWGAFGTVIGIPYHFMSSLENVTPVPSLSRGRFLSVFTKGAIERPPKVAVKPEDGIELSKSVILTDEEKIFILMREMISSQNNQDHLTAVFRILTIGTSLGLMYYTREIMIKNVGENLSRLARTNLHKNGILTKLTRGPIYMLIITTGLLSYYSLLSLYKNHLEKQSDRTVAAIGKKYAEGGRDYYRRVLSRNLACRKILGPTDGNYLFNNRGDMKTWFFRPETPVSERLAIMEEYLSKYEQEKESDKTKSGDQEITK